MTAVTGKSAGSGGAKGGAEKSQSLDSCRCFTIIYQLPSIPGMFGRSCREHYDSWLVRFGDWRKSIYCPFFYYNIASK